jgi:hypothetical protein
MTFIEEDSDFLETTQEAKSESEEDPYGATDGKSREA